MKMRVRFGASSGNDTTRSPRPFARGPPPSPLPAPQDSGIEHVVGLMMENRTRPGRRRVRGRRGAGVAGPPTGAPASFAGTVGGPAGEDVERRDPLKQRVDLLAVGGGKAVEEDLGVGEEVPDGRLLVRAQREYLGDGKLGDQQAEPESASGRNPGLHGNPALRRRWRRGPCPPPTGPTRVQRSGGSGGVRRAGVSDDVLSADRVVPGPGPTLRGVQTVEVSD